MKNIILSIFCLVFFLVSCDNMNLKKGENINDIIEISENPLEKPENQAENTREIYEISVQTEVRKSLPVSIKSLIPEDENLVLNMEDESAFIIKKDVNGDDLEDWIIPTHEENNIRLYIFQARETGYVAASTGWITCPQEYNNYGNSVDALIEVSDKSVISFYLSWMRSDMELKFRYEKAKKDYYLIGLDNMSRGADYYIVTSINYLSGKKIISEGGIGGNSKELPEKKSNIKNPMPKMSEVNDDMLYRDL